MAQDITELEVVLLPFDIDSLQLTNLLITYLKYKLYEEFYIFIIVSRILFR